MDITYLDFRKQGKGIKKFKVCLVWLVLQKYQIIFFFGLPESAFEKKGNYFSPRKKCHLFYVFGLTYFVFKTTYNKKEIM
ncbi:hypothetical protein GYH30_038687 [Glycine max]|uniref:Uncharacterized protein n=1 Tax=Glycine max TaxID=3847 RepID=A0A0R0GEF4_SOYBN|nr:hypothetical protein GYH30_038687 [Glycine max]